MPHVGGHQCRDLLGASAGMTQPLAPGREKVAATWSAWVWAAMMPLAGGIRA